MDGVAINKNLNFFPFMSTKKFYFYFLNFPRDNLVGRINQQETNISLGSPETIRRELFLTFMTLSSLPMPFAPRGQGHAVPPATPLRVQQLNKYLDIVFRGGAILNIVQGQEYPMNFDAYAKKLPQHKKKIDRAFLEWFIGYSEGDGSFGVHENRPVFVINQAELQVLHHIRTELGFGVVSTFKQDGRVYARYTVKDNKSIERLIAIFNGNLQLQKTQKRFNQWVNVYNTKNQQTIIAIIVKPCRKPYQITLQSAWLAGFFDAEGGFSSRVVPRGKSFRLYVQTYVDQKFELETLNQIAMLFNVKSVTVRNNEKSYYRVDIKSKKSVEIAIEYFNTYKLCTRKKNAYALWLKIANLYIKGEHLLCIEKVNRATERLKDINSIFKRCKSVLLLEKQKFEQSLDNL
uniref:Putative LAGLIDADG homing endonuclease n=1 Tax=Oogamochlamys gigantea TaxID=158507 RepID=A0A0S2LN18_9CHLO|nr:putative LAGLIDADG homing endonuclease [Oogamochlamys gigantea]ALO62828.1 putative LAGLIDADG homing endonuclease [Oogamochlamys gigantea]